MSDEPRSKPPVIPAPPPGGGKRRKALAKGSGDRRWLVWASALALGIALGMVTYQTVTPLKRFFDYWVVRALS
jgi:hypothetical protein